LLILPPHPRSSPPIGRVVGAPVSLRDLAATIVELAVPSAGSSPVFPGNSLLSPGSGPILSELEAPPEADPNQGDSPVCRGPMASLVAGGYHYIRSGDGREELYDLEADPHETRNLARSGEVKERLRQFRGELPRRYAGQRLTMARRKASD
jgi:arylsulfatase A-like enzyme